MSQKPNFRSCDNAKQIKKLDFFSVPLLQFTPNLRDNILNGGQKKMNRDQNLENQRDLETIQQVLHECRGQDCQRVKVIGQIIPLLLRADIEYLKGFMTVLDQEFGC